MTIDTSNSIVTVSTFDHNNGLFEYLVYRAGDIEIVDKIAVRDMDNNTIRVKTIEDYYFNVEV
jgi:hypothetical protein